MAIIRKVWVLIRITTMAYHSDIDGKCEMTSQTLEDRICGCMINFGGSWNVHLLMTTLANNNNYHTSIKAAPSEASSVIKCRPHIHLANPFK